MSNNPLYDEIAKAISAGLEVTFRQLARDHLEIEVAQPSRSGCDRISRRFSLDPTCFRDPTDEISYAIGASRLEVIEFAERATKGTRPLRESLTPAHDMHSKHLVEKCARDLPYRPSNRPIDREISDYYDATSFRAVNEAFGGIL